MADQVQISDIYLDEYISNITQVGGIATVRILTHDLPKGLVYDEGRRVILGSLLELGTSKVMYRLTASNDKSLNITLTFDIVAIKDVTYSVGDFTYEVIYQDVTEGGTVRITGLSEVGKTKKKVSVPKSVKLGSYKYEVKEVKLN